MGWLSSRDCFPVSLHCYHVLTWIFGTNQTELVIKLELLFWIGHNFFLVENIICESNFKWKVKTEPKKEKEKEKQAEATLRVS